MIIPSNFVEIKFAKGLRNMTVPEGSDANFQVEIANPDIDTVRWERNGKLISEDGHRTKTTAKGREFSLIVKNVKKNDEAAYSCVVGSAKTVARLYIEGRPTMALLVLLRWYLSY